MSTRLTRQSTSLLALLLAILPTGLGVFAQSIEHPHRGLVIALSQSNVDTLQVDAVTRKSYVRLFDFSCVNLATDPDSVYGVSLQLPSGDQVAGIVLGYTVQQGGQCSQWVDLTGSMPSSAIVSGRFQGALYIDPTKFGSLTPGRYIFRLSLEQAKGKAATNQRIQQVEFTSGKSVDTVSVYLDLERPNLSLLGVVKAKSYPGQPNKWWLGSDSLCATLRASDAISGAIDSLWMTTGALVEASVGGTGTVERTLCLNGLAEQWHNVYVAARDTAWGSHPLCDSSLNTPHDGLADSLRFSVKVDLTAPTVQLVPAHRGRWVNAWISPQIQSASTDTLQTNLVYARCTTDVAQAASLPFPSSFRFPGGEGMYYLQAVGEDSAGNIEAMGAWEDSVGYDVHSPTVSNWQPGTICLNVDSLELSLLFEDPVPTGVCRVSGLDSVFLLGRPVDADNWTVQWSHAFGGLTSAPAQIILRRPAAGDGRWVYAVGMVDVAGNADTTAELVVEWDQTKPGVTLTVPDRARADPWSVRVRVTDALCGIDSVWIDTSYAADAYSRWLTLALSCGTSLDTTLYFPPDGLKARNGVYHFRARATDCAGNDSSVIDSTIFFRSPDVAELVLADTSSSASRHDHPADPGFTNEPTVVDTVRLTTMPEDPTAYLQFAAADRVPKVMRVWRDPESSVQVDTLNLADLVVFRDGSVTVFVRLVRPAYHDTTVWDSTKVQIDRSLPAGTLVLQDPETENNRCSPQDGWTNEPRVRVLWKNLSQDVREVWPPAGQTLSVPTAEASYRLSAVVHDSAWVDDHAGNVVRSDPRFTYDATTVGEDDQKSWLEDPDTGGREYVDGDTVLAAFHFTAPATDGRMGVRGVWKVAYAFGKKRTWTCSDFDSSEANPHVFTVPDSVREDTSKLWLRPFEIPEQWQQNGKLIFLSHAFIDSTGDISHVFVDSIRWVGLTLTASFEDPEPWRCQSAAVWSNERDSILIRVDTTQTTWAQIDTIELDYRWTPRQPDDVFVRPEQPVFTRPMSTDMLQDCGFGRITLRAKDRETGASVSYTDSLHFDFSKPDLGKFVVQDAGSVGLPEEYRAQGGWTNRDTVRVSVRFDDTCSALPLGYVRSCDWQSPGPECRSDTAWLDQLKPGDGEKQLELAAVDSAGNGSVALSTTITLDTRPPEWDAQQSGSSSPRLFCEKIFRSKGDSVWVKVGARDDRGLAGFAFVVEEPDWSNGNGVTVWMVQDSVWSCDDSILVRFQTTSDTFYVYGLAFDKAGNCSRVDSALVYVTRPPKVRLTVFDARDLQDSVYVNYPVHECVGETDRDSVLIHLSWERVDSIVILHDAESFTFVTPAYTGSTDVRTTIASRCSVSYYDSLTALAYQLGVVGARRTYTFVVDHQAPSVQVVDVVSGPNSAEVVPFVSQPEAWVLVRASDAVPGKVERFWCRAGHSPNAHNLLPDDSTVVGDQAWYHFTLPEDSTGWWYFGAKAWDGGNSESPLATGKVDYRRASAAFCYPNPFTPPRERVALSFVSNKDGEATVEIYDAFGYLVWKTTAVVSKGVVDGAGPSGGVSWDGRNLAGDLVASGGYICRIKTPDGRTETVKIGVVR